MPVLYEIYNIFIKVNCLQGLCSGSATAWGFFSPNPGALDHVTQLVQLGKVTSNPSNIINYIKAMFMYPWTQHSFPKTSIKEKKKGLEEILFKFLTLKLGQLFALSAQPVVW